MTRGLLLDASESQDSAGLGEVLGHLPWQVRAGAGAGAGDHFEVAQHREKHDVRGRRCILVCLLWSDSDSRNGELEQGCSKGDTDVTAGLRDMGT